MLICVYSIKNIRLKNNADCWSMIMEVNETFNNTLINFAYPPEFDEHI